jgi:pimeloyl-ACP methyl ester carboxylesterase
MALDTSTINEVAAEPEAGIDWCSCARQLQYADVGKGRRLAYKSFGELKEPGKVVLYDPGSFGSYCDGVHLCDELAERGYLAITYSRAGMYPSDPLPDEITPHPAFHTNDIERLLDALGIPGPILLAGHSMAGVRLHYAGHAIPDRLSGLIFLDAVCPSLTKSFTWAGWTAFARTVARAGAKAAASSLSPLVEEIHPNVLKLTGEDRTTKLKSIASADHLRAASAEIRAMDRKTRSIEINEAVGIPALYVTATAVSQGTTEVLKRYEEEGVWARHIRLPNDGHMSMLAPPSVEVIAAGVEALWRKVSARPA